MRASLKIPTATLIANAEKALEKAKREYGHDLKKYEVAIPRWEAKVAEAFATADPSTVVVTNVYRDAERVRVIQVNAAHLRGKPPIKPSEPRTAGIEADIRFLRATTQETVAVSVGSDLARYL